MVNYILFANPAGMFHIKFICLNQARIQWYKNLKKKLCNILLLEFKAETSCHINKTTD